MMTERRHQNHEIQENSGILGEIPHKRTRGAQDDIKSTLLVPQKNYGKDNCIIHLTGPEETY
jgi:hypothetical protein